MVLKVGFRIFSAETCRSGIGQERPRSKQRRANPYATTRRGGPLAGHRARNSERDLAERGRARVHLDAYLSFKRTSADDVADLQFVVVCSLLWRSKKRAPPIENEGIR